jgi:hypothetical protein
VLVLGGDATVEDCDIDNCDSGVATTPGHCRLTISGSRIHDNRKCGVLVEEDGRLDMVNCEIQSNLGVGVWLWNDTSSSIRCCRINRNGGASEKESGYAIAKQADARLDLSECDLSDNLRGDFYRGYAL